MWIRNSVALAMAMNGVNEQNEMNDDTSRKRR